MATTGSVFAWWLWLCFASVLNAGIWLFLARRLQRGAPTPSIQRLQLQLAGLYVLGCGFRSLLPRADVQRICLFDTWLSSVIVGRAVATVAEFAFALQWALLVRQLGTSLGVAYATRIGSVLFPLIVGAEISSWYAVLSANFLGNAIEQSTWTLSGILLGSALVTAAWHARGTLRGWILGGILQTCCFVAFMSCIDVPMYFSRFLRDEAADATYMPLYQGLIDSATRWVVTWDVAAWRGERLWMALYFSIGVWTSLALCCVPVERDARARAASA